MEHFGGDEDDRESGASPEGSSDNEHDNPVEVRDDEDAFGEGAPDADAEGEAENEEDNEDEDENPDQEDSQIPLPPGSNGEIGRSPGASQIPLLGTKHDLSESANGSASSVPTSHPHPAVLLTSPSPMQDPAVSSVFSHELPKVSPEVVNASVYDIVPTIAAPHSTSINAIAATPDLRWVFTGGADGYIRKFNWIETANGKSMLTVAQRHPFVDSVTKAGVLMSYWENSEDLNGKSGITLRMVFGLKSFVTGKPSDDTSSIPSVYSLAVQREGLWLLSGLESGGINLQSVRHDEGKQISCLRGHTSAVSVLNLAQDERSLLSGSWDKAILDWDLNTGKIVRKFEGSGGQISALETRPLSSLPVPESSGELPESSITFKSDSVDEPKVNGISANGVDHDAEAALLFGEDEVNGGAGSPADSLFGGNDADSLFGENDNEGTGDRLGQNFPHDEDDDFSRAIAHGIREQEREQEQEKANQQNAEGDVDMEDTRETLTAAPIDRLSGTEYVSETDLLEERVASQDASSLSGTLIDGLPQTEEQPLKSQGSENAAAADAPPTSESTFLAAAFDGSLRVWDKRQHRSVAKIIPQNVPPWCMNACWSPDGNFIYAGRRNGSVDEYSLHKGVQHVERNLKLPNNSGPVSALRAMPNGRHLIW